MATIAEQFNIELTSRSAFHEWTREVNLYANNFADVVEAGGKDLKKRLKQTPVAASGYWGRPGSLIAARQVTSGIFKAVEHLRAVPLLMGKAFYTFDGLYVPVEVLRDNKGGLDPTK